MRSPRPAESRGGLPNPVRPVLNPSRPSRRPPPDSGRDISHFIIGLLAGLGLSLLWVWTQPRSMPKDLELFGQVRDYVHGNFVDEVDGEKLVDDALRGMIYQLDEYSRYFDASQVRDVARETEGRYVGLGAVFRSPTSKGQVLFTLDRSPAHRAGLRVGDQIIEVRGEPVEGLGAGGLAGALRGQVGEQIPMIVRGLDGDIRDLVVLLEDLLDPSVRHTSLLDEEHGIGYLAIRSFSDETPREFDHAVEALRRVGMKSLIVDVRGNYGGVLQASILIANRFISEGVLVSTEGRGIPMVYSADPSQAHLEGLPLVVLVDGDSASASEVFAAALQDYRAAVLVGEPTYGKGMVQRVRTFGRDEAVVKLTTSYYFTPSHRNLERTLAKSWAHGIAPDLWIEADELASSRIHGHLDSYSPPYSALDALEAWSASAGEALIGVHPEDPQRNAAVALLRGEALPTRVARLGD